MSSIQSESLIETDWIMQQTNEFEQRLLIKTMDEMEMDLIWLFDYETNSC